MSVDYFEQQRRRMARSHLRSRTHWGRGSLYFPYHGRRPCRHPLNLAHVSMVHAGNLSIVPSDCDRIPACFGDNATISGIASPINAGALLEFLRFVDCHYCFSGASVSLSEAVKRQLRRRQNADRQHCVFRCCKPSRPRAKVAGGDLVADLRRPRSDVVKAVLAHIGTSRLGKPHSTSAKPHLISVLSRPHPDGTPSTSPDARTEEAYELRQQLREPRGG